MYLSHVNCPKVQDAYSLRCAPQVHGIVYETIDFVKTILEREMNSATDNPMVFSDTKTILSGGNFHGEYPAKVLDYLAIAIHELGNISERRMERLVNPNLSELEAFLVKEGGLNSGFMIAHCTAAALVSENKTLCHPASVDSIPTSAEKEDHVSMGGWAARKVLNVVSNVEVILAIELLAICQAIDLRRPERTTYPLEKLHETIREFVSFWDQDRYIKPDIDAVAKFIRDEGVPNTIAQAISSKL
jgi:histidine ammonia-lyase